MASKKPDLKDLRNKKIRKIVGRSNKPVTEVVKSLEKKYFVTERTIYRILKGY